MQEGSPKALEQHQKKQKARKQDEGKVKKEKKQEKKEEKIDSIFMARQIVRGDEERIAKWLFEFRQVKSANIAKFTDKILSNLNQGHFTFKESINRFMAISNSADDESTTGNQMAAILAGFHAFWVQIILKQMQVATTEEIDEMFRLFNFVLQLYVHIGRKFITVCRDLISKFFTDKVRQFEEEAHLILKDLLSNKRQEQNKILPLVHEFNLYDLISYGKIVDLVLKVNNINQFVYIFTPKKDKNIDMKLLSIFVDKCSNGDKRDLGKCQTVLRNLKVDPFQFQNYIITMQKMYIRYQMRTFRLFNIELIVSYSRDLLRVLIDELAKDRKTREMKYFVVKYNFENQYKIPLRKGEREELLQIRNILLDNDYFGPTEVDILEEVNDKKADDYVYMGDFEMGINHVMVVTSLNINQIDYEKEFSTFVGMDQERGGGTHVFDPSVTSTLQLYNGSKVFIFDILQLKDNKRIRDIMTHIFKKCQIYGQDITKELTVMTRSMKLDIEEKQIQELMKNRVHDSSKEFKRVFPKQTRSNLSYQCEVLFKKTLSKYEQCSGWFYRPLRKAQLHYAALDCVLPFKICEELSKISKP